MVDFRKKFDRIFVRLKKTQKIDASGNVMINIYLKRNFQKVH